jgi:hypothetical protein
MAKRTSRELSEKAEAVYWVVVWNSEEAKHGTVALVEAVVVAPEAWPFRAIDHNLAAWRSSLMVLQVFASLAHPRSPVFF